MPGRLAAGATTLTATTTGGTGQLDAVQLTPLVSTLETSGAGRGVALLHSAAGATRTRTVALSGTGREVARSYDASGRLLRVVTGTGSVRVAVPPGGFAIVVR